mmetsp:Transcript_18730/g.28272  ORF Transcript_18730/g.28272 Transcript_18730/m.28272 type:complete len:514 (-) Transcript_18730:167-1708(-)|eukprot:CAMPEP_0172583132 /NCGR_PEP_ID=MMETSP1068-20121228/2728_1 /TAXON_ID=35684 /ORGANISM="Pseudopedinella elastica, Strain CCMP716" /LENGTH=513 /DNA_ID=CAMNT_0013376807 /DNA_START=97 /DNA_END=1638 /DNA_ORIENTATION=-
MATTSEASAVAKMFDIDNPQEAANFTIMILVLVVGLSIIFYALSALCIVGEAMCCLVSLMKCFRRVCGCCVSCMGKNSSNGTGQSTDASSGSSQSEAKQAQAGQLMSLVIMVLSILTALIWEFYFATEMDDNKATGKAWSENCQEGMGEYPQCLKFQAVYRVAFVCVLFFGACACVTAAAPALHNEAWDLKIFCWAALMIGLTFAPNRLFDDHGFIWIARVGAFLFLILQQVILIDTAYGVNEFLVDRGYAAATRQGAEGGLNAWLIGCLLLSLGLFAAALTGLVLMFVYYTGCDNSNSFISLTLLFIAAFTLLQLFATKPDEGGGAGHNFLTTAVVASYVVYLCFISVSANPTGKCNPSYSEEENLTALVLGLGITFVSITATTYFASKSVTSLVTTDGPTKQTDLEQVLTGGSRATVELPRGPSPGRQMTGSDDGVGGQSWKFNLVMALIACYWCCVLTNWGNPGGGGHAASPTAGNVCMWMNIVASWVCASLYTWTMVAPLVFPDRDFSA